MTERDCQMLNADINLKSSSCLVRASSGSQFQLSSRESREIQRSKTKLFVTEDDKKFLQQAKETFDAAVGFRSSQQIVLNIDEKWLDDQSNETLHILLNCLAKVMKSQTASEKHANETEAIEEIKAKISGMQGEKSREFLKYFSNLRKNFADVTKTAIQLQNKAEIWTDSIRDIKVEYQREIEAEKAKADKLFAAQNARKEEIKNLKAQVQNLLELNHQKELNQQVVDTTQHPILKLQQSNIMMDLSQQLIDDATNSPSPDVNILAPRLEALHQQLQDMTKQAYQQTEDLTAKTDLAESLQKNCTYLEGKITSLISQKEETIIDLKSQIIIYKQKAKGYKAKLQVELEDFKKNALLHEKYNCQKEIDRTMVELNEVKNKLSIEEEKSKEVQERLTKIQGLYKVQEKELREQVAFKEITTQQLKEQIETLQTRHECKIHEEGHKRVVINEKVQIQQQQHTLTEVRIDYLVNNQKKQQLQKKFLEQQLEKDMQQLSVVMNRTELELKKDQLISSSLALNRLQMLHRTMNDSLKYMRKIVNFMIFDHDVNNPKEYSSLDEEKSINQLQKSINDIDSPNNSLQESMQIDRTESAVDNFQANYNHEPGQPIPLDKLVKKHQFELIEVLFSWLQEYFHQSKTPTHELAQAISIVQQKADPLKASEIKRTFLSESRIHHAQHMFKQTEKIMSLEAERKVLHGQLSDQMSRAVSAVKTPVKQKEEADGRDSNIEQAQVEAETQVLIQENGALKARIKEVRLTLNKQNNDLQDTLKMTKSSLENEMTQLKIKYGKDLARIQSDYERSHTTLKKQIEQETRVEFDQYKIKTEKRITHINKSASEEKQKMIKSIEDELAIKDQYFLELQKLKQESAYLYQGAFGTFTLAFENPLFASLNEKQKELQVHRQNMDVFRTSVKGSIKKKRNRLILTKFEEEEQTLFQQVHTLEKQIETVEIQPMEKLCHFIEVGFQIAQKNFQHLQVYNELTYDTMARKYLFEFQMPLQDNDIMKLEHKLRDQIQENFALFNEISPVFVSLNLGRPVNQMSHDCIDIENFRIIGRQSIQVNHHYLTINFLKCDLPMRMMRIVAFNNQTCQHFQVDLTTDDLLILTEGHLKLLEEESIPDLINLILNSLTIIKRKVKVQEQLSTGFIGKPTLQSIEVLVVEHRCFFSETNRANWDNKKKKILMRTDKRLQGIVRDVETSTDFDKAQCYEAFQDVYDSEFFLRLQPKDLADHFTIVLKRGVQSGNLMLDLKQSNSTLAQTLCLFNTELQQSGKTNNLASALIQPERTAEENQDPALALCYVVSIESIFGREEVIIVKVTSVQRKFADMMDKFQWDGESAPSESATTFSQEIFYLVRKVGEPYAYYRVKEYQILHTESRVQLFTHSFGYEQRQADFGMLMVENQQEPTQETEGQAESHLSPEGVASKVVSPVMSLRESQTSYIRQGELATPVPTMSDVQARNRPTNPSRMRMPQKIQPFKGHESLIIRQFVILRFKTLEENERHVMQEIFEKHFALVSLYATEEQLEAGKLQVSVDLTQLNQNLDQLVDITDLIPTPEARATLLTPAYELKDSLLQHLVVQRLNNGFQVIYFDNSILPINEELQNMRMQKFDQLMLKSVSEQFQMQIENTAMLGLGRAELMDCQKLTHVTFMGQRVFKFTGYFIPPELLKKVTVKGGKHFPWKVLWIDAYHQQKDTLMTIAITEADIERIISMLQDIPNTKTQLQVEKIYNAELGINELMHLALDIVTFDPFNDKLVVSFDNFKKRMEERHKLEGLFMEQGAYYVKREKDNVIDEYPDFETSVPKTELNKKLLLSLEKDFSDSKIDIKVYITTMRSLPKYEKIQIELFSIDYPSLVWKCNYLSQQNQRGHQLFFERFNLLEQSLLAQDKVLSSEEEKVVRNRGLVLSISEAAFPHEFTFVLLEPCSHIFWSHQHTDNQLNQMERRRDKQAFAHLILQAVQDTDGIVRKVSDANVIKPGYDIQEQESDLLPTSLMMYREQPEAELVYGKTFRVEEGVHREIKVYFRQDAKKLVLFSSNVDDSTRDPELEIHILLANQKEHSRFYQGVLVAGKNPLVFRIEQAVGSAGQRVLRLSVNKITEDESSESLLDCTIADPSFFIQQTHALELKEERKFYLNIGYREIQSCLPKIEDIAQDIANCSVDRLSEMPELIATREENFEMIYRTVMKTDDQNFVITALGQRQSQQPGKMTIEDFDIRKPQSQPQKSANHPFARVKINLFEMTTNTSELFMFSPSDILSNKELQQRYGATDLYKQAIDLRLRVKELDCESIGETDGDRRYVVFFVNPALLETSGQQNQRQLFTEIEQFDIRKSSSETKCDTKHFKGNQDFAPGMPDKKVLVAQFETDDLLYDVHQELNPYQLVLRINSYARDTYKLVSSKQVLEQELIEELHSKRHLLEATRRQELAKYLVQNIAEQAIVV